MKLSLRTAPCSLSHSPLHPVPAIAQSSLAQWVKPQPIMPRGHENSPAPDVKRTSLNRLTEIHRLCASMGVHTKPLWLEVSAEGNADDSDASSTPPPRDVLIVPLDAWYHTDWDVEPDLDDDEFGPMGIDGADSFKTLWTDFHLCKWPDGLENGSRALAERVSRLNEPSLQLLTMHLPPPPPAGRPAPTRRLTKTETYALYDTTPRGGDNGLWSSVDPNTFFTPLTKPRRTQPPGVVVADGAEARAAARRPFIISASHMVPRQELIPEKRMLLQPSLHRVSGSEPLEAQIRRLMPDIHAFGHTHLNMDLTLDGVRYVQWPLGTPREQKAQTRVSSFGLMNVFDGSKGGETAQHWTHWGRHYEEFERDLTKTARPPYVTSIKGSVTGPAKQARSTWGFEQSLQHQAGATSVGSSELVNLRALS